MSAAQTLTGSIAASHVIKWLRMWYRDEGVPDAIDLEIVRQMLPGTPYGTGVREIRPPVQINDDAFEVLYEKSHPVPSKNYPRRMYSIKGRPYFIL